MFNTAGHMKDLSFRMELCRWILRAGLVWSWWGEDTTQYDQMMILNMGSFVPQGMLGSV